MALGMGPRIQMKMKMIRDWIGDLFENGIGETDEDENGLRCL